MGDNLESLKNHVCSRAREEEGAGRGGRDISQITSAVTKHKQDENIDDDRKLEESSDQPALIQENSRFQRKQKGREEEKKEKEGGGGGEDVGWLKLDSISRACDNLISEEGIPRRRELHPKKCDVPSDSPSVDVEQSTRNSEANNGVDSSLSSVVLDSELNQIGEDSGQKLSSEKTRGETSHEDSSSLYSQQDHKPVHLDHQDDHVDPQQNHEDDHLEPQQEDKMVAQVSSQIFTKENSSQESLKMRLWITKSVKILLEHLNKYGVCVVDNFVGEEKGGHVLDEIRNMQKMNCFKDGQVMSGGGQNEPTIRSDKITWTDGFTPLNCPNLRFVVQLLDSIVLTANKVKNNGELGKYRLSGRTRIMAACYPGGGTRYVKHVDNPNRDGRVVTAIYYLNRNWNSKTDGGTLKIYSQVNKGKVIQVDPLFDRVVFFWSDSRNPHEVLPANRPRYAVTVWYLDDKEKQEYNRRLRAEEFLRNQAQEQYLARQTEEENRFTDRNNQREFIGQGSSVISSSSSSSNIKQTRERLDNRRLSGEGEPRCKIKHSEDRLLSDFS